MMEAVRTSETSVYFETTLRYIPEGSNLYAHRRENLKSHIGKCFRIVRNISAARIESETG
jgi:hypothetical protein